MDTRQRRPEERSAPASPGSNAVGGTGGSGMRERASELLEVADRAIERALSGDSTRFLSQNRQAGGQ